MKTRGYSINYYYFVPRSLSLVLFMCVLACLPQTTKTKLIATGISESEEDRMHFDSRKRGGATKVSRQSVLIRLSIFVCLNDCHGYLFGKQSKDKAPKHANQQI